MIVATESKKRKVLIVSFAFPPANTSGAVRVGKFAKYLPQFGWEPLVLTVAGRRDVPQTLAVEVDDTRVVRIPHVNPEFAISSRLASGDVASATSAIQKFSLKRTVLRLVRLLASLLYTLPAAERLLTGQAKWYHSAVKEGVKLLNRGDIDVIFSSLNPAVCHLVAARLHRETGIPWVADFRDLWVDPYSSSNWLRNFLDSRLEKRVMKKSKPLVAISKSMAARLEAIHHKKVVVVENGFDTDDYLAEVPLTSRFTITYTGNIYPGKRDPTVLLEAIRQLLQEGKISAKALEVRFFSSDRRVLSPIIKRYHLKEIAQIYDFVPFEDSARRQKESTVLLLLEWDSPLAAHVYSSKIFEYLGAGRPVLAIAYKNGIIDRLLAESGCGVVLSRVNEARELLLRWLHEFQENGTIQSHYQPDPRVINRYTRREQTRKLAAVLDKSVTHR